MNTALLSKPRIIVGPGQYVTRSGEIVTVKSIELPWVRRFYGAVGHYPNGTQEKWDVSGRCLPLTLTDNDVVRAA